MLQYQSLQYYLRFSTWLISLLNGEKWYVTNWEMGTGDNKAETVSSEHVQTIIFFLTLRVMGTLHERGFHKNHRLELRINEII